VREDAGGAGDVGETESAFGEGGGGVRVAVGGGVRADVTVSGGACVNVAGEGVTCPEGWNGVGVGDAFGSCVMSTKVEMTGAVGVWEAQEERNIKSNT